MTYIMNKVDVFVRVVFMPTGAYVSIAPYLPELYRNVAFPLLTDTGIHCNYSCPLTMCSRKRVTSVVRSAATANTGIKVECWKPTGLAAQMAVSIYCFLL